MDLPQEAYTDHNIVCCYLAAKTQHMTLPLGKLFKPVSKTWSMKAVPLLSMSWANHISESCSYTVCTRFSDTAMELHHEEDLFPSASLWKDTAIVVGKLLAAPSDGLYRRHLTDASGSSCDVFWGREQIKGEQGEEQSSCLEQNQDTKNKINQSSNGCEEEKCLKLLIL